MLKSRKSSSSSSKKKKKSKKLKKYWDASSSDVNSGCSDSDACEGGGNAILAYIILAIIGIVCCVCVCYCLIKMLKKVNFDDLKKKRKSKAVERAEVEFEDHMGDVKKGKAKKN